MKISKLIILITLMVWFDVFAQNYPEITIRDVQYVPDSLLIYYGSDGRWTEPVPPLLGDTVIVTGVVMVPPYEGANPDSIRTLHAGVPAIYLQDTAQTEWSGILVRDESNSPSFTVLDTGLVIKVLGYVNEYFTTTQINVVDFQAADIIGVRERPKPVLLTLDSLVQKGTSTPNFLAEKWEGVYVEIRNLTATDPGVLGDNYPNTFVVFDENNSSIIVGNNSDYFRRTPAPLAGTKINYIRGYIETRTNIFPYWFMINPVFPDDIEYGSVSPPNITDVKRDKSVVGYNEDVTVTAMVFDSDSTAPVVSASLKYSVSGAPYVSVPMTLTDSTTMTWSATIPGQPDSAMISYYIEAVDADSAVSTNPTNGEESPYFYFVLNRPLTIQDVQYSPFGSGFSGYNNYEVTVSGVVTADTSDIEGDGNLIGPQVYIQNGTGPWSGIQIFGTQAYALHRGDYVTVTGIVNESFGVTRIGNLTNGVNVTVNSAGNPLPAPFEVSTAEINGSGGGELPAESYEGVLLSIKNISVVDENANGDAGPDEGSGGNRNFGEMLVADTSGVQMRVELQDGTHDYHNFWDQSLENQPIRIRTWNHFDELRGILFYSFGNFKLVPRKNDDFIGFVTSINEQPELGIKFELSQNYPNPFNPTTKIKYSVPSNLNGNSSVVKLVVYDILGRAIKTLVNEKQQPGRYEITFNANDLASGIYFYRLTTGDFVSTKKMILMK